MGDIIQTTFQEHFVERIFVLRFMEILFFKCCPDNSGIGFAPDRQRIINLKLRAQLLMHALLCVKQLDLS